MLPAAMLQVLALAGLLTVLCSSSIAEAVSFGTKIEAGEKECYTELVEAGGTLGFTFRVTDGGSFDIDASISATSTPPLEKVQEASRVHFNSYFAGRRDRQLKKVLNTWERASEGSFTYTAPNATESRHGLPVEITICFDNHFSSLSPKWVRFTLMKRDVLEVDPDAVNKVESEMEKILHHYGTILFQLAQDADVLRLSGEAGRVKLSALSKIMSVELLLNIMILMTIAAYQYISLARFLHRESRPGKINVSAQ